MLFLNFSLSTSLLSLKYCLISWFISLNSANVVASSIRDLYELRSVSITFNKLIAEFLTPSSISGLFCILFSSVFTLFIVLSMPRIIVCFNTSKAVCAVTNVTDRIKDNKITEINIFFI